ncbi:PTS fructose transporter subunit IIB [Haloferacaceae archaeon DSL9]
MKLVAVTSCPTGIAHSQMAAENLESTAEARGHEIHVEVQGAMGTQDELSASAIAEADAVIIAADTSVSTDRFDDAKIVKATVKDAVNDAERLVREAEELVGASQTDPDAERPAARESPTDASATTAGGESDRTADAGAATGADTEVETDATTDADRDDERLGGDPSKGLFARLKRLFS